MPCQCNWWAYLFPVYRRKKKRQSPSKDRSKDDGWPPPCLHTRDGFHNQLIGHEEWYWISILDFLKLLRQNLRSQEGHWCQRCYSAQYKNSEIFFSFSLSSILGIDTKILGTTGQGGVNRTIYCHSLHRIGLRYRLSAVKTKYWLRLLYWICEAAKVPTENHQSAVKTSVCQFSYRRPFFFF